MKNLPSSALFMIISIVVTLFLFYIDEGFYNFQWMKSWGNWVVFVIYAGVIFLVQQILSLIFRKIFKIKGRNHLVTAIGVPLAIFILVTVIFR